MIAYIATLTNDLSELSIVVISLGVLKIALPLVNSNY